MDWTISSFYCCNIHTTRQGNSDRYYWWMRDVGKDMNFADAYFLGCVDASSSKTSHLAVRLFILQEVEDIIITPGGYDLSSHKVHLHL